MQLVLFATFRLAALLTAMAIHMSGYCAGERSSGQTTEQPHGLAQKTIAVAATEEDSSGAPEDKILLPTQEIIHPGEFL